MILFDGVQVYEPELGMLAAVRAIVSVGSRRYPLLRRHSQAITVPTSRLFELPLRSTSVIVPDVVGVHFSVRGSPPVADIPSGGMMNGLGFAANATSGAARRVRSVLKYIVCALKERMKQEAHSS